MSLQTRWRQSRKRSDNWRPATLMFFTDERTYEGIIRFLSDLIH